MKEKDYKFALKYLEETSKGLLKLSKEKKFKLPFMIFRIQVLLNTNVDDILQQIPENFFNSISTAYNVDNIYFFVLPVYFEMIINTLKNLKPEIIETIGSGFLDKVENQFLMADLIMLYSNKAAKKGIVKIDATELEWKGEPAFSLELGKQKNESNK